MPFLVTVEETLRVGSETVLESPSPRGRYAVVFEDDGETGYFYGLDLERGEEPIVDALHVYNVKGVVDADRPSALEIAWSEDGLASALLINEHPHAAFDFAERRACCRTNFPPADGTFAETHEWDDAVLERLA